jgi:hypothetical protein
MEKARSFATEQTQTYSLKADIMPDECHSTAKVLIIPQTFSFFPIKITIHLAFGKIMLQNHVKQCKSLRFMTFK